MKSLYYVTTVALVTSGLFAVPAVTRAEIVEEIVAWVNGEIITRSEYEEEKKRVESEAGIEVSQE